MWRANRYLPFEILEAAQIDRDPQETGGTRSHWVRLQEYGKSVIENAVCCECKVVLNWWSMQGVEGWEGPGGILVPV